MGIGPRTATEYVQHFFQSALVVALSIYRFETLQIFSPGRNGVVLLCTRYSAFTLHLPLYFAHAVSSLEVFPKTVVVKWWKPNYWFDITTDILPNRPLQNGMTMPTNARTSLRNVAMPWL